MTPPDALLLIATGCPHCPTVLAGVGDLVKQGKIGRLEVVNIVTHPEVAQALGVRRRAQVCDWGLLPGLRTPKPNSDNGPGRARHPRRALTSISASCSIAANSPKGA